MMRLMRTGSPDWTPAQVSFCIDEENGPFLAFLNWSDHQQHKWPKRSFPMVNSPLQECQHDTFRRLSEFTTTAANISYIFDHRFQCVSWLDMLYITNGGTCRCSGRSLLQSSELFSFILLIFHFIIETCITHDRNTLIDIRKWRQEVWIKEQKPLRPPTNAVSIFQNPVRSAVCIYVWTLFHPIPFWNICIHVVLCVHYGGSTTPFL